MTSYRKGGIEFDEGGGVHAMHVQCGRHHDVRLDRCNDPPRFEGVCDECGQEIVYGLDLIRTFQSLGFYGSGGVSA